MITRMVPGPQGVERAEQSPPHAGEGDAARLAEDAGEDDVPSSCTMTDTNMHRIQTRMKTISSRSWS